MVNGYFPKSNEFTIREAFSKLSFEEKEKALELPDGKYGVEDLTISLNRYLNSIEEEESYEKNKEKYWLYKEALRSLGG